MMEAARSEIAQQRRELDRIRTLHKSEAASQAQLDAANTRVSSAQASLAAAVAKLGLAKLALRNASVAAPFDGLVARRFVSAGDHVSEGEKLFDLVALDPIEVEFHLTERDSGASRWATRSRCASRRIRTRCSTRRCRSYRRGSIRRRARCA
jgi:membrane fusion protein (multidrug efflux system)